jgi:hypothetical protein
VRAGVHVLVVNWESSPMTALLRRALARLTYANVLATLAFFLALGGTGVAAITLARDSVGARHIRDGAVGASEIRRGAVGSAELRNRGIRLADISSSARASLRGAQGPAGPPGPAGTTYRAAVNSGGSPVHGNARNAGHTETGVYTVEFDRDVSSCIYGATLARVAGGQVVDPPAGRLTVASAGGSRVLVRTYNAAAQPADAPFHLLVAC